MPEGTSVAEWFTDLFAKSVRCGQEGAFVSTGGQVLCAACADEFVEATLAEKNIMGMWCASNGSMPASVEEARSRWLLPIN